MEFDKTALEWVKENKKRECTKGYYSSPRVSSEYQDCSTPFSLDTMSICSAGCNFCFSYFQKSNNPAYKDGVPLKPINVKRTIDMFEGKYPDNQYYKAFIKKRYVLHIGGMADNFDEFEARFKTGVPLIEYFLRTGYPIIISTKFNPERMPEYKEMFEKYKDTAKCAIQFSIITTDLQHSSQIETGCPSPDVRFKSMKWLSELGYFTILRLRPFMIGTSDKTLNDLLNRAKECGAKALSTEFFCMESRTNSGLLTRYKEMSDTLGFDLMKYYKALSPSERGGYLRLNRDIKEPHIKKMYKFCKENDMIFACSDPDFKELNSTGSCCGLPNDPKWGLNNYCKAQLTQLIISLKERYIASQGKDKYLTWQHLLDNDADYLKDKRFYGDSLKCWDTDYARSDMNHLKEFQQVWNNLRSPKNPYCYFHGLLKPVKVDGHGNIIFKFNPPNYFERWRRDGTL